MNDIKLIRDGTASPCVATIGTFDSLHVGHQALIQEVINKAKALSLVPTVITFEPPPPSFWRPGYRRIMPFSQKLSLLLEMGIRQVVCLRFNAAFAKILPREFIKDYLVEKFKVRFLLIGEGFRFGHQQQGNVQTLIEAAKEFGFGIQPFAHVKATLDKVSSTLIRQTLLAGNLKQIPHLLGRHFSIHARVGHGAKRGQKLGFPTANLAKHPASSLLKGVFVTKAKIGNNSYQSVANCGTRPTVNGIQQVVEVHLLDYAGDLYGKRLMVEFLHKLRDEKHFADIEQLKQQIIKDIQATRTYFEGFL